MLGLLTRCMQKCMYGYHLIKSADAVLLLPGVACGCSTSLACATRVSHDNSTLQRAFQLILSSVFISMCPTQDMPRPTLTHYLTALTGKHKAQQGFLAGAAHIAPTIPTPMPQMCKLPCCCCCCCCCCHFGGLGSCASAPPAYGASTAAVVQCGMCSTTCTASLAVHHVT